MIKNEKKIAKNNKKIAKNDKNKQKIKKIEIKNLYQLFHY